MNNTWDVIIIGAGSVGVPAALATAQKKLRTLVIDALPSPGQMNNKKAIGGIRATHSDFGKIKIGQRSIDIFATWQERHGDDIGWLSNGYSYPAYTDKDETALRKLMKTQLEFGLNIRWVSPEDYNALVPGINMDDLRGSTYSPEDGSASPLLALNAIYFKSLEYGTEYRFSETVTDLKQDTSGAITVQTQTGSYTAGSVINCAGNNGREIAQMMGEDFAVIPDNHEGAITEPVKRFFGPMVVDMRKSTDSLNYYFYQNNEGQVIFCITPDPPITGIDNDSTSGFFPQVARRMVALYPRLAHLKIRRSWRGQYPATPDGFPIVGPSRSAPEFIQAIGMCGQGFMLGPGLGELLARIVSQELTEDDHAILKCFDPYRKFSGMEVFK